MQRLLESNLLVLSSIYMGTPVDQIEVFTAEVVHEKV
jgi:hypothetical protein